CEPAGGCAKLIAGWTASKSAARTSRAMDCGRVDIWGIAVGCSELGGGNRRKSARTYFLTLVSSISNSVCGGSSPTMRFDFQSILSGPSKVKICTDDTTCPSGLVLDDETIQALPSWLQRPSE